MIYETRSRREGASDLIPDSLPEPKAAALRQLHQDYLQLYSRWDAAENQTRELRNGVTDARERFVEALRTALIEHFGLNPETAAEFIPKF